MTDLPRTYREIHRRAVSKKYRYSSERPDPKEFQPPITPKG